MNKRKNSGVTQFGSGEPILPSDPNTGDVIRALNWYNATWDIKKLTTTATNYLKQKKIKKTIPPTVSVRTAGAVIRLIERKQIPDNQVYLKEWLERLEDKVPTLKSKSKRPSIQESTAIKQNEYITGLDNLFERFIETGMSIYGMKGYLYDTGMKASYVQGCMDWAQSVYDEIQLSMSDPELKEGYSNFTVAQKRKILHFFNNMLKELGTYRNAVKPVRKRKPIPASKVVQKVKFQKFDEELNIVSVIPEKIIGSSMVFLFNTKTRMLSYYKSMGGLSVSGTSIKDFDVGLSKKIRTPSIFHQHFRGLGKRVSEKMFLNDISTKQNVASGRINSDTIILKVF
jgi:hypothetical protein